MYKSQAENHYKHQKMLLYYYYYYYYIENVPLCNDHCVYCHDN